MTGVANVETAWPEAHRPAPFTCSASAPVTDRALVQVTGELDCVTAPRLRRTLQQAQRDACDVVLDLTALEFADSSAVHAILDAHHRAELRGDHLGVVRGAPQIQKLFNLTGAAGILHFTDPVGGSSCAQPSCSASSTRMPSGPRR